MTRRDAPLQKDFEGNEFVLLSSGAVSVTLNEGHDIIARYSRYRGNRRKENIQRGKRLVDVLGRAFKPQKFLFVMLKKYPRRGDRLAFLKGFEKPLEDIIEGFAGALEAGHPFLQIGRVFRLLGNKGEHSLGGGLGPGEHECSLCIRLVSERVTQPASPDNSQVELVDDGAGGIFSGPDFHGGKLAQNSSGCDGNVTSHASHWVGFGHLATSGRSPQ